MHIEYVTPEPGIELRAATWEASAGGAIGDALLLAGRGEFVEKYDETARQLIERGWRVWSFDWRGQGLSTRLLPNRQKGHIDDFETYVRDLAFVVAWAEGRGAAPSLLVAHSMGAHIACRYLTDRPRHPFERCVLTSPMIAPRLTPLARLFVRTLAAVAVRCGFAESYVLGQGDFDERRAVFEGNPLTHDRRRFCEAIHFMTANPDLRLGGITYGWLDAALRSSAHLLRAAGGERFPIPCLVIRAADELIVDDRRMNAYFAPFANAEIVRLASARHEILRETDAVLNAFWDAFDRFVNAG